MRGRSRVGRLRGFAELLDPSESGSGSQQPRSFRGLGGVVVRWPECGS